MSAPDLPAVRDRLFASLERGQLLLLVGAGASRWAGLPSWRDAVCALAADLVPAIYTTNFDDLLGRTFAWAGRSWQVVAGPEDLKAWRFDTEGPPVPRFPVYKLHGTLGRPGSLVVSETDFLRRSDLAANPTDLRFCSDVMGRELLLVGYGFNDPNMRWIWAKLRDLEVPPVGWFLELGASSDLERATMELDGIVRVDLEAEDVDRPRELLAFLQALADRCERELGGRPAAPVRT